MKAENIQLTDEELEEEYKKAAENYKIDAEELKKYVPEADMRADAEVSKAIQFVRDNAEITAVEAKAEEPAEE